jgi:hypothetical protein
MLQPLVATGPQRPEGPHVNGRAAAKKESANRGPLYHPLERLVLTDGVARAIFDDYARHRAAERGREETGWALLGLREPRQAIALATLPAGELREAGVAHVQFNSTAQAVAGRIVRQKDRRLTLLGVVHTHPGSHRRPSDGDFRGDRQWVAHLRGGEGAFGIGTADVPAELAERYASQPRPNVCCLGELRLSWYALKQGASSYRPLPVQFTLGPDLAADLHAAWPTLEAQASRLERLLQQLAHCQVEALNVEPGPGLLLRVPLPDGRMIGVILRGPQARYLLFDHDEPREVEAPDERIDRGVFLLLARLSAD